MRPFRFLLLVYACLLSVTLFAQQANMVIPVVSKPSRAFQRLNADTAFLSLKNIFAKALAGNDKRTAATCLRRMGKICFQLTNYPQALEYHLQADKLLRERVSYIILFRDSVNQKLLL